MAKFLALQVIMGKLRYASITKTKKYAKYADLALEIIREKGYEIDEEGNCVFVQ